jgi:hypothetical protein
MYFCNDDKIISVSLLKIYRKNDNSFGQNEHSKILLVSGFKVQITNNILCKFVNLFQALKIQIILFK